MIAMSKIQLPIIGSHLMIMLQVKTPTESKKKKKKFKLKIFTTATLV
jgi:hypothetical protein